MAAGCSGSAMDCVVLIHVSNILIHHNKVEPEELPQGWVISPLTQYQKFNVVFWSFFFFLQTDFFMDVLWDCVTWYRCLDSRSESRSKICLPVITTAFHMQLYWIVCGRRSAPWKTFMTMQPEKSQFPCKMEEGRFHRVITNSLLRAFIFHCEPISASSENLRGCKCLCLRT